MDALLPFLPLERKIFFQVFMFSERLFTHRSVSTFDRVPFQLTDESFFSEDGCAVIIFDVPAAARAPH
jgi:hypothetical protein